MDEVVKEVFHDEGPFEREGFEAFRLILSATYGWCGWLDQGSDKEVESSLPLHEN